VNGVLTLHLPDIPTVMELVQESHLTKRFEFVRIDVCPDGNCPTMSMHQLLEHWPQQELVWEFAKIVGFA
jgi:hypothetical protein